MTASRSRTPAEIYFDNNATTRVLPVAAEAAQSAMGILYGNPSSSHITGLRARHILERTRRRAGLVLGAGKGRIIFTSGATEAIQMAILSALRETALARAVDGTSPSDRVLLYGATEHRAVPEAMSHWNTLLGVADEVLAIPVDSRGRLDLGFIREHAPHADMVATMAVNNETGVITDLAAVETALRGANAGVRWLVDCVQAVGKHALNLASTTIDFAAVSGHKLYAPKGIGLLYVREDTPVTPLIAGGGQEAGARSGTENLPGVAALGAVFGCLLDAEDETFHPAGTIAGYRDRVVASLRKAFPDIIFNTDFDHAVPTTINFSVKSLASKEVLDIFDAAGIRVSSGSACGSAVQGSYVLEAMGLPDWQCESAVRLSLGPATEEYEVAEGCRLIEEAGKVMRGSCLLVADDVDDGPPGERRAGVVQLKRGSNCSWIYTTPDGTCVVIDPIAELADRIEKFVRCQRCRVIAVLDTHDHNDRPSCRPMLIEILGERARDARTSDALGWPDRPDGTVSLADGGEAPFIRLSDDEVLARVELPGHTVEGRGYLLGSISADGKLRPGDVRFAFTGDTLLIGGIGRTDFQASVAGMLHDSLRRLDTIVDRRRTVFCPTHDYSNGFCTTIEAELRGGGILARVLDPVAPISREDFVDETSRMDREIESGPGELICGLVNLEDHAESSMDVGPDELAAFFEQHAESIVCDVRELQESGFVADWSALGLSKPPINIPLTRFTDFVQQMLLRRAEGDERDIVFVCRSGSRSGRAASVMQRLGIAGAWHIHGGLAVCAPDLEELAGQV